MVWVLNYHVFNGKAKERGRERKVRQIAQRGAALWVLIGVLSFNQLVFNSPNLSTSSSTTLFYSHQKFHYLSLPKFDMDVFLTNGKSTSAESVLLNKSELKFIADSTVRASLLSVLENPQRFVFAEIQKVDSYFFPHTKSSKSSWTI